MYLKLLRFASILLILILSGSSLKSQMGINFRVHTNNFEVWNEVIENADNRLTPDIFNRSFQIGLDYGFDMSMYRVSFFPEISFSRADDKVESDFFTSDLNTIEFKLERYAFNFKTFIYPLDLLSKKGMSCPSFHRGADKFTKGWYILVFPELAYSMKSGFRTTNLLEFTPFEDQSFIFNFGIGTGLDIGITSNLSISPHFMYSFSIGEQWEGFSAGFNQPSYNDSTNLSSLTAGLRIGFWFN